MSTSSGDATSTSELRFFCVGADDEGGLDDEVSSLVVPTGLGDRSDSAEGLDGGVHFEHFLGVLGGRGLLGDDLGGLEVGRSSKSGGGG